MPLTTTQTMQIVNRSFTTTPIKLMSAKLIKIKDAKVKSKHGKVVEDLREYLREGKIDKGQ